MKRLFLGLVIASLLAGCSPPDDEGGCESDCSANSETTNTNSSTTSNNSTTTTNNSTSTTNNSTSTSGSTGGTNNTVRPEDCTDDEVFVSDYCQRCGQANGCDSTGPECRPACANEGEPCETGGTCFDGACRRLCG